MKNKLGINENKFFDIERKLVNLKMNLLDEYFTFNKNIFELDYLKELHKFLFSDLYYEEQLEMRKFVNNEEQKLKNMLISLKNICIKEPTNIIEILKVIQEIWHLQPFSDGNTRTLIAYLIVINYAFLLDLDININKEIISSPTTFNLNNFVNQKRLTKLK